MEIGAGSRHKSHLEPDALGHEPFLGCLDRVVIGALVYGLRRSPTSVDSGVLGCVASLLARVTSLCQR